MDEQELATTVQAMMQAGKGLLAMDESNSTCNQRFAKLGIPQTEEARRAWRELILTTPGLGEFISGTILYDETIRQSKKDGTSFVKVQTEAGIIPGIKVDAGALAEFATQLSKEMDESEKAVYRLAGTTFNLNSPRQLGQILFDILKIGDAPKKTRTGQYSTDEQTLTVLTYIWQDSGWGLDARRTFARGHGPLSS